MSNADRNYPHQINVRIDDETRIRLDALAKATSEAAGVPVREPDIVRRVLCVGLDALDKQQKRGRR